MNKIPIKKNVVAPRHHIIHKYKSNPICKHETINKPIAVKFQRDNTIKTKQKIQSNNVVGLVRPPKVKSVSVKSTLIPKRQSKSSRDSFDSRVLKIKSIKGVGKGKILVILAPGPSILEAEIEKLNGIEKIDSMTINKPDKRLWPSDYWMFCDRTQYDRNKDAFHKYFKTIINTDSIKANHPKQIKIKNMPGKGFSVDMLQGFYIGRSTTFSAMQVAAWMGYEKIFIFGCDMCRVGKKLHSYGVNPDVPEKVREKRFKKEAEFYDVASKIMGEDLRNKYYFCSSYNPWPFIDKFKRMDQKVAIEYILNCAKEI